MSEFDYSEAFSRNLGWVNKQEFELLRKKKIAIAGMGGVGGIHLITLVRMGFCRFHLADFDHYELANFNRQYGANLSSLGKNKLEVMVEEAKKINPEIIITGFNQGVQEQNIDDFLQDVDLYIDGLDAFILDLRLELFAACWQKKIPAITYGPLGFSVSGVNFIPGKGLSFAEYFGMVKGQDLENAFKFFVGLSPNALHLKALVERSVVKFGDKKGPSTPVGCTLSAGVVTTEAVKILLQRGEVMHAPASFQFDAYTYRLKKCYLPWGYKNPFFKLRLQFLKWLIR